jgi:hypothetical protein
MGNLDWHVYNRGGELIARTRYACDAARLAIAAAGTVSRNGRHYAVPPGLARWRSPTCG